MAKPKKCISTEKAVSLQDYWCDTRGKMIAEGCGYEDCREFWYSIDEIEEYIKYFKKKAKKLGLKPKNLGLRVYLGTYPATEEKHDGLSTIFFAPTVKKKPKSKGKEGALVDDSQEENIYSISPMNLGGTGWPPINYEPPTN